jgi:WD40 repeat protein
MELTGHSGEVFAARFDPTGLFIASGSMDRSICQFRMRRAGETIADECSTLA